MVPKKYYFNTELKPGIISSAYQVGSTYNLNYKLLNR